MDAYRLRDEWARLANLVLRCPRNRPWQPTGGPVDEVVAGLDGFSTLADVVAARLQFITPVVDPLIAALNEGRLERVPAGAAPVRSAPGIAREDFYELMDRARSHLRSEDYAGAEALLRRALELRPGDRVARQNLRALSRRRGIGHEPGA
ncbi:MAG TPA: hypothetical protein VIK91_06855 [Nannocystis sp.]